jgi:uncharacterized protein (DUF1015 family)
VEELATIEKALATRWIVIADGHHRYESALRYARSLPAPGGGPRPFDYVLMVLCNIEAGGLTVLPIHRMVHSIPDFGAAAWLQALEAWFERRELELPADPAAAARRVEEALAPHRERGGAFVITLAGAGACLLTLRPGFDRDRELGPAVPGPLRGLDVSLAQTLILERALSMTPEEQAQQTRLRYSKSTMAALEELAAGQAQAAVLMNPTPVESVVEITRTGLRLPAKSTFFHPKLISGLIIHPFDDD